VIGLMIDLINCSSFVYLVKIRKNMNMLKLEELFVEKNVIA